MDKELDSKFYAHDQKKIDQLEEEKPWKKDPRSYSKCKISALAAMRMLKHTLRGVEKGRARDKGKGLPLEVMGLMVGRPQEDSIIILDALPLPCDGFESEWDVNIGEKATRYMLELSEQLEKRGQKERIIGWYHSHPFEVGVYNNCFMSAIDVNTQSNNQLAVPHWTGVVIDPLRCVAKSKLEMAAFRAYPMGYTPPADMAPDGESLRENKDKNWGTYPEKYYMLETTFFMSSIARSTMELFSKDSLWIRILSDSQIDDEEYGGKVVKRIGKCSSKLNSSASMDPRMFDRGAKFGGAGGSSKAEENAGVESSKLAHELCKEQTMGMLRKLIFRGCTCNKK
mmetsp:Transcript_28915/g.46970  ORF Transcript_28915/g.46970 Transcript_28915/m.46970 type:complete len:340 (-) Transcript_28915:150-1169(-)